MVGSTLPDLTVILDLPLEVAHARRDLRHGDVQDPAEATRDFVVIREALIAMARQEPERCHVLDADQPPEAVARDIWRLIEPFL